MIDTQFHVKVKKVRSDNGTEFVSDECQQLFLTLGIQHQKCCAYTPQQNGVVERKHRHLLDIARALMFQSKLPLKFWPYSLLAATYILNRLPSSALHWKTPFETLYGNPSYFDKLKPFGCLAYATNVTPHKDKFQTRAHKCVFIGYVPRQKGYKLYNLDTNQTMISKDVSFIEDHFPYHYIHDRTAEVPLPNVSVIE